MSLPKILLYRAIRPALYFLPNDPISSRSTGGHLELSSINNRRTATIFIRFLAYFPEANLSSTSLSSIFWKKSGKDFSPTTRKYSKTFSPAKLSQPQVSNNPKIFKDYFGCKIVLAANQQQPENIQRLFRLQNCLSRKSATTRKYSKTFWAAINSSNQQQQSTAATSSSFNQQQQPAAAINSSNQQQQSTAATSISNQEQQLAATTSFHPTSSIYTIHDDFR